MRNNITLQFHTPLENDDQSGVVNSLQKHHTGFDSLKVGLVVWSDSDMVECRTVTVRLCCLGLDPLDGSSRIEDKLYVLSSLSAVDRSRMVSRVFSLKVDSVRSRTPNHTPNRLLT